MRIIYAKTKSKPFAFGSAKYATLITRSYNILSRGSFIILMQFVNKIFFVDDIVRAPSRSSTEQNLSSFTSSGTAPPTGLQNVEQFGSFLGEEIVANWRRSLERTIISQSSSSSPPNVTAAAAALSLPVSKSFQLPPSPTNTSPVPHSPHETESHKTDYSHDAQESSEEIGKYTHYF